MANEKISAMPAAPQPFNGAELFPLVGSDGVNDSAAFAALVYEILNNGLSGVLPATVTMQDVAISTLKFDGSGNVFLNNNTGAQLHLDNSGAATLNDSFGAQLHLDNSGAATLSGSVGAYLFLNSAGQAFLSDTVGSLLALNNDGSLGLQNESGAELYFDASGNVSLSDGVAGLEIGSGIVNFDNYPTFTPGSYSGTITTASLVGKTMTFTNGLLTSFS